LSQYLAVTCASPTMPTLSTQDRIPREAAEQLVARLAWRGISGWPRSEH